MQDNPHVLNASDISQGDVGIGISLGLQPREILMPLSPREMSYTFSTLGNSCYNYSFNAKLD